MPRRRTPDNPLSPCECNILRELWSGAADKEIAWRLHLSPGTVKCHLRRIEQALGVKSRVPLALWAERRRVANTYE
jgi:DNA-binding NarL/FixJ family response regulator